jgi:hypothetical protein
MGAPGPRSCHRFEGASVREYGAPVRRFRMIALLVAMTVATAACGGGGDEATDDDVDGASPTTVATTVPVPTTGGGTTVPAASLTLRITDLRLVNSEESDNGVRVLLPAGVATASVTVNGLPNPNRVISVCQANDLDRRMSAAACRMPANGEAVNVNLGSAASGVEIVQAGTSSSGPAGNMTILEDVTIRYSASSREVTARLAQIAAGESGGRPSFTLTPAGSSGAYRAQLAWSVIQVFGGTPTNAQLELVQGGTATKQAEGGGLQVRLEGTLSPAGEAAFRVTNNGSAAMVTPKLALLLP